MFINKWLRKDCVQTRALTWLSVGVVLFVTCFLWSPSRDGLDVVFILAIFLPMLAILLAKRISLLEFGGEINVMALSYAAFSALACLWGNPHDWVYFLVNWFVLAIWLIAASYVFVHRPLSLENIFRWMIGIALVVSISSIIIFYQNNPLYYRLNGWSVARYAIVVSQVFGSVALIALVLAFQAQRFSTSFMYFICALLLMVPMALSQSRGPALAIVIMAILALFFARPKFLWLMAKVALVAVILLALIFFTDLLSLVTARGVDWSERDTIWLDVFNLSLDSPLIGIGTEKNDHLMLPSGPYHHPHNAWLDIFYRTGVIGLILALGHLWLLCKAFKPTKDLLPLYMWLGFGCICLFTDSRMMFWELNAKWFLYWIPAGLIAAIYSRDQYLEQRTS